MVSLVLLRQEAYCQARAKGLSQRRAATSPDCNYSKNYGHVLDQKESIRARIVEIYVRAVETSDFERRLRELEEAQAACAAAR